MRKQNSNVTAMIIYWIAAIIFLVIAWHAVICYDTSSNSNVFKAILDGCNRFQQQPLQLSITKSFGKGMAFALLTVWIAFLYIFFLKRKTLFGREQGSAEWASNKEMQSFQDKKDFFKNMLLSKNVFMSMDTRFTRRNNNILLIGGSGSGKTRFFAKPNLMQANCSYVITDPKGGAERSAMKSSGTVLLND